MLLSVAQSLAGERGVRDRSRLLVLVHPELRGELGEERLVRLEGLAHPDGLEAAERLAADPLDGHSSLEGVGDVQVGRGGQGLRVHVERLALARGEDEVELRAAQRRHQVPRPGAP